MAVTATPIANDVAIVYDNAGSAVTRRYTDVKVDAADADVYEVAAGPNGFASLQDLSVASVQRRATNELESI